MYAYLALKTEIMISPFLDYTPPTLPPDFTLLEPENRLRELGCLPDISPESPGLLIRTSFYCSSYRVCVY